jgi:hypothetical protein
MRTADDVRRSPKKGDKVRFKSINPCVIEVTATTETDLVSFEGSSGSWWFSFEFWRNLTRHAEVVHVAD